MAETILENHSILEKSESDIADVNISPVSKPIIALRDVVKDYVTGAGCFTAINGINLDILEGEFLGIIGKSGAGKTTLLNLIAGVSEITSGDILFYEGDHSNQVAEHGKVSVGSLDENELASWRGRNLGIVYQSFELMPQLNLVKNIMLPQDFAGSYQAGVSAERALELLEMVELSEHAYKLPAHISGGQKQRVAITRALVNDPAVILADEPTGNLDTVTAETIFRIFEKLVENGKTIIMVTHDANLASRFSRRVYISDGEIVEDYSTNGFARVEKRPGGTIPEMGAKSNLESEPGDGNTASVPLDQPREDGDSIRVMETVISATLVQPDLTEGSDKIEVRDIVLSDGSLSLKPNGTAISLRDVVKTYVNAAGEFNALKGINLQMSYGQFISIVGKSGSGKSTLLNMLTGIDYPTSGEVIIGGEEIYKMSESRRALWRGRSVGIVFQFFQLLPALTLLENVMLPMDYCNVYSPSERPERALELLKMVGLEGQAYKLPSSVSSGHQQSAAIARALATDPPIIVADEPTGNLDSRSAEKVLRLFSGMAERGKTILIVTHDPSFTKRTDQTVILADGEIIDDAVARALPLLNHPQMLQATHKAEKRLYQPGSTIIRQGQKVDYLFMIASGEVDVVLANPGCPEISLARLGPGQFFGEIELMHSEKSIASARAASAGPVELSLLPKEDFHMLLRGSPQTQEVVEKVAQLRLDENLAYNGECGE